MSSIHVRIHNNGQPARSPRSAGRSMMEEGTASKTHRNTHRESDGARRGTVKNRLQHRTIPPQGQGRHGVGFGLNQDTKQYSATLLLETLLLSTSSLSLLHHKTPWSFQCGFIYFHFGRKKVSATRKNRKRSFFSHSFKNRNDWTELESKARVKEDIGISELHQLRSNCWLRVVYYIYLQF